MVFSCAVRRRGHRARGRGNALRADRASGLNCGGFPEKMRFVITLSKFVRKSPLKWNAFLGNGSRRTKETEQIINTMNSNNTHTTFRDNNGNILKIVSEKALSETSAGSEVSGSWELNPTGDVPSIPELPTVAYTQVTLSDGRLAQKKQFQYRFSGSAAYYTQVFSLTASCVMDCGPIVILEVSSDDTATLTVNGTSVSSTLHSGKVSDALPIQESDYGRLSISVSYNNIGGPFALEANVISLTPLS